MVTCVCNIQEYLLHRQTECTYTVQGHYVKTLHIGSTLTLDNNNKIVNNNNNNNNKIVNNNNNNNKIVNGLHHPNLKLVSKDIFI